MSWNYFLSGSLFRWYPLYAPLPHLTSPLTILNPSHNIHHSFTSCPSVTFFLMTCWLAFFVWVGDAAVWPISLLTDRVPAWYTNYYFSIVCFYRVWLIFFSFLCEKESVKTCLETVLFSGWPSDVTLPSPSRNIQHSFMSSPTVTSFTTMCWLMFCVCWWWHWLPAPGVS